MYKQIAIIATFLAILFSSCKKEFLDTAPTNQVSDVEAVKSTQNAWAALNGIHRALTNQYDAQPQGGEADFF